MTDLRPPSVLLGDWLAVAVFAAGIAVVLWAVM